MFTSLNIKPDNLSGNHILVGLGGTGGKILKEFKMRMFEEFPNAEDRKKLPIALLYIDSSKEMMPQGAKANPAFNVMGMDASFENTEFLFIKTVDVENILANISHYPNLKGIVGDVTSAKTALGAIGEAAAQKRRAGRILFAANIQAYLNSLESAFNRAKKGKVDDVTIHIFAGLSGGTGSGSIIDAIVQTRKKYPNAKILVYAMMAEMYLPKPDMDQGRYYPNCYAAMNEINSLQAGSWNAWDVLHGDKINTFSDNIKGVVNGLTIYSNVNENGIILHSLEELPKTVSDYVFSRIFYITSQDKVGEEIIRAYNCENKLEYALEYDETACSEADNDTEIPVVRTKKTNTFGIKRVMYPELRILKYTTYRVARDILYSLKFQNWKDNEGYVDRIKNKDYEEEYTKAKYATRWHLTLDHFTLQEKILPKDKDCESFKIYWSTEANEYFELSKKADNPLTDLHHTMEGFYKNSFRGSGVEEYYVTKENAIPAMVNEIRHTIESDLYTGWKDGVLSTTDLLRMAEVVTKKSLELKEKIDNELSKQRDLVKEYENKRTENEKEWAALSLLERIVGVGKKLYAYHKEILAELYTARTMVCSLGMAQKLAAKLSVEISKMNSDVSAFAKLINEAIDETEKLITANRKKNAGIEDMKGAIIEVSDEMLIEEFTKDTCLNKTVMIDFSNIIRNNLLPEKEFYGFNDLIQDINISHFKDTFDIFLSEQIIKRHQNTVDEYHKILGHNVLTQLKQQLKTDEEIKEFAYNLLEQSGVYLSLNDGELNLYLRNNEGPLSPANTASKPSTVIGILIPSADKNEQLQKFAGKLKDAFEGAISTDGTNKTVQIITDSPRKNELTVMIVKCGFPMRAIEWLKTYKERYDKFLHTGNAKTDASHAILLHSEGRGSQLSSLFVVENADEIVAQKAAEMEKSKTSQSVASEMPPMPGQVPPPISQPDIKLYIAVNSQPYGPYDMAICRQMVQTGQLTPHSSVWMEGMTAWQPAKDVMQLKALFMPAMPPTMPTPDDMPKMTPTI